MTQQSHIICPRKSENMFTQNLYINVYNSCIHNSSELETILNALQQVNGLAYCRTSTLGKLLINKKEKN